MIDKFKGFLFDIDGVLYVGDKVIDGAAETIKKLREAGKPCRFTTNTTTKSLDTLHRKLIEFGLPVEKSEIYSSTTAAVLYLRHKQPKSCYFLLTDDPLQDFAEFEVNETKPEYVVIGDVGKRWSYDLMNNVFNMVINGAEMIALHKGRFWQIEEGLQMDIGAFVAGLEYVTGKTATVIGKPMLPFFTLAIESMNLPARSVLMVGDDIINDIQGAQKAGMKAALVKTGKYRKELIAKSDIKPDYIIDSVAGLTK